MTVKLHKDPDVIAHADRVLLDLAETSKSLTYATFLTDDGFEVTRLRSEFSSSNRIAAMASSMQALGDAVSRDLKIGACGYLIVAGDDGYMIQLRVPGAPLVLAASFDAAETVGKALSVARLAAAAMSEMPLSQAA